MYIGWKQKPEKHELCAMLMQQNFWEALKAGP